MSDTIPQIEPVTGTTVDNTVIGGTTPAAGAFTTLSASGLITATGGQIKFPATQAASADANTLDDYEEGTWTPVVTAGTGTITTSSATGAYTKIGNQITFFVAITITTNGTGASEVIFTLPAFGNSVHLSSYVGRETAVTGNNLWGYISNGAAVGNILNFDKTYPGADGRILRVSGSYVV